MSIQALPGDVVAQIKSSVVITSLNGVVFGLLQNALDAGASKVNISLDYSRGNCSVDDDGHGIPPDDFRDGGGLGKLHYTSKYPPRSELHGRRGVFLASLAALSLLTISSHHREYRSHNALTIHNSKVVARNTPALPGQELLAFASGTRVAVRDLFGAMPVRVKQRTTDRLASTKSFDQLVLSLVAIALSWPRTVAISVRDANNRRVSLRSPELAWDERSGSPLTKSIITRTERLLAQASLAEGCGVESWVPLAASVPGVSVNGCVSLVPVATRRLQFVSLGVRPLLNEYDSNILYEAVNGVFANSSFGAVENSVPPSAEAPRKLDSFTIKELKARKGPDRWPVFYLRVELLGKMDALDDDAFLEGDSGHGDVGTILDLLRALAYEFLKKHHFRPKPVNAFEGLKDGRADSPDPPNRPEAVSTASSDRAMKRRRVQGGTRSLRTSSLGLGVRNSRDGAPSPFSSWARVKTDLPSKPPKSVSSSLMPPLAQEASPARDNGSASIGQLESRTTWSPFFGHSGKLLRKPFEDVKETPTGTSLPPADKQPEELASVDPGGNPRETIVWRDPVTKMRSLVDRRTGLMVKESPKTTPALPRRRTLVPDGLDLSNSSGRVFQPPEAAIPSLPETSEPLHCGQPGSAHRCAKISDFGVSAWQGMKSTVSESRFTKDALRGAVVVGQVDGKFILVKMCSASSAGFMLVLIDQHAADERCKVEELMRSYFPETDGRVEALSEVLEKPLRFDFSQREGRLLAQFGDHFRYWGIGVEVLDGEQGLGPGRHRDEPQVAVEVQTLPPSIAERCRLEPRLLADLLRKQIWKLCDNPGLSKQGHGRSQPGQDWISRFHGCPDGIQDLLNSRACRSAIMFNDPLTTEECVDLVRRLAACYFPFQCAHGRPSMVPIVDLGKDEDKGR